MRFLKGLGLPYQVEYIPKLVFIFQTSGKNKTSESIQHFHISQSATLLCLLNSPDPLAPECEQGESAWRLYSR